MIIIISGIVWMGLGNLDNFHNSMSNSDFSPSRLSLAFYSGLFSYAGWNYLNFVTEELKDPNKNLPRAIYVSMPLVTCTYLLANVAYFAVLNTSEILASNAVAVVSSSFWSSFSLSLSYSASNLNKIIFLRPLVTDCLVSCGGSCHFSWHVQHLEPSMVAFLHLLVYFSLEPEVVICQEPWHSSTFTNSLQCLVWYFW